MPSSAHQGHRQIGLVDQPVGPVGLGRQSEPEHVEQDHPPVAGQRVDHPVEVERRRGEPVEDEQGRRRSGPRGGDVDGEDPVADQGADRAPGPPGLDEARSPERVGSGRSRGPGRGPRRVGVPGRSSRSSVSTEWAALRCPCGLPGEESSSTPTNPSPEQLAEGVEPLGRRHLVPGEPQPEHADPAAATRSSTRSSVGVADAERPCVGPAPGRGRDGWLSTGATTTSSTIMARANPPVRHMPTAPTPGPPHRSCSCTGQGPQPRGDGAGPVEGQHGELLGHARLGHRPDRA